MAINVYDAAVSQFSYDGVVPQLGYPSISKTVKLQASKTYVKGAWIGPVTASPGTYGPYVHANVDGTQNPIAILPRDYVTDASGNIFEGQQGSEELPGVFSATIPAWFGGVFNQSDITLTSAILTDLLVTKPGATVIFGTIATSNATLQF